MIAYNYQVTVLDRNQNVHRIAGACQGRSVVEAAAGALKSTFDKLVGRDATVQNCGGPYTVDRVELTRVKGRLEVCGG